MDRRFGASNGVVIARVRLGWSVGPKLESLVKYGHSWIRVWRFCNAVPLVLVMACEEGVYVVGFGISCRWVLGCDNGGDVVVVHWVARQRAKIVSFFILVTAYRLGAIHTLGN